MGVERHVDDARAAAGRQGAGAGSPALPMSSAGVVEVHVGVDHAGQHMQSRGVDDLSR